ncbi:TPA: hypothetical protein DEB00_01090 [Candidatus Uhrbacteria bacterium]|nr:hypothetical protein [Candidatus Uhrbacteria bacterium]
MAPRGEGAPGIPDGADISAAREKAKKITQLEQKTVYPPADALTDLPEAEALDADIAAAKAAAKQEALAMAEADPSHIPKGHETPRPGRGIEAKTQDRAARQRVGEMDVKGFGSTSPEQRAEMAEMQSVIADYDGQINTVRGLIEQNPRDWKNLVSANPELGTILTMTGEDMNRARTDLEAVQSQSSFIGRLFSGAKRRELREAQGNLARMENNLSEAYNALAALTGAAGERLADRTTATSPETSQVRGASYEVAAARSGGRTRRVEETPELTPEELAQTQEMPALTEEENILSPEDLEEVTTAQRLVDYAPEGIRSILEGIANDSVSPEVAFDMLEEEEGFVDWNSDLVGKILDGVKDGRGKAMEGAMTIKAVRKNSSGKPTVYLQREDGKNLTMGFANFLKNNVQ